MKKKQKYNSAHYWEDKQNPERAWKFWSIIFFCFWTSYVFQACERISNHGSCLVSFCPMCLFQKSIKSHFHWNWQSKLQHISREQIPHPLALMLLSSWVMKANNQLRQHKGLHFSKHFNAITSLKEGIVALAESLCCCESISTNYTTYNAFLWCFHFKKLTEVDSSFCHTSGSCKI